VRSAGLVVAAALAAGSAAAVAGSAEAQSGATMIVTPPQADPGATVFVSNGLGSPCPPPLGAANASASVDLFGPGSATPANRVPYQARVTSAGSWSVEVRLAPDLPPGQYRVQAGCYTDSGLNSGYGPSYEPGRLDLRLQSLGQATVNPRLTRAGEGLQVTSGELRCPPPAGAPSPRVRVSLLDSAGATRAEAEGPVDPASGRWSLPVRVPSIDAQDVQVTAVCLARVGAAAPYARYAGSPIRVQAPAVDPPERPPTSPGPAPRPASTVPGGAASTTTTALPQVAAVSLPATPVATAIAAEPTYTG